MVTKFPSGEAAMIKNLVETSVMTQHKMADLLIEIKDLSGNVKDLVSIFQDAASHIKAGKYEDPLIEKLNDLLEQNKNLAKGLLLLEKYSKDKSGMASVGFKHPASEF